MTCLCGMDLFAFMLPAFGLTLLLLFSVEKPHIFWQSEEGTVAWLFRTRKAIWVADFLCIQTAHHLLAPRSTFQGT